jgi:hypothetical protein
MLERRGHLRGLRDRAYELRDGARISIITEADRSVATILLPDEY